MTSETSLPFTRIAVFCKRPVAGRVKTRLAAGIGNEAALAVYQVLLAHTVEVARASGMDVTLCVDPPEAFDWFASAWPDLGLLAQAEGDLGRRLAAASETLQADGSALLVIGSDCPGLTPDLLREARAALSRAPVVLGPSADGGYWLVGLRQPLPALFEGMPWSRGDLMAASRERLRLAAIPCMELAVLRDLDDSDDLRAAIIEHPTLGWP